MKNKDFDLKNNIDLIKQICELTDENKDPLRFAISKFVCYFNLFESFLYTTRIGPWYLFCKSCKIKENVVSKYFNFFYDRYITNGKINNEFEDLCKHVEKKYKDILKKNLTNKINKNYAVLSISYYFINYLFHGHKKISELDKFIDSFNMITDFLCDILKCANQNTRT